MISPRPLWIERNRGETEAYARFSDRFQILRTIGMNLGVISGFVVPDFGRTASSITLRASLESIHSLTAGRDISPSTVLDALTGETSSKDKLTAAWEAALKEFGNLHLLEVPSDQDVVEFLEGRGLIREIYDLLDMAAHHRPFFVTDTGKVGVSIGHLKEGDILAGLFGINYPFVVREMEDHYIMINVAHVGDHPWCHDGVPAGLTDDQLCRDYGFQRVAFR